MSELDNKNQEQKEESQQEASTASGGGLVVESRIWYRDRFRQVSSLCMLLAIILVVSLGVNACQVMTEPEPRYFAVSDDLRIKDLRPLSKPAISQSGLFNWTTRKVTETFSIDFVHWRENLMSVRPDYTEKAFSQLIKSLKSSGNLQMIKERRLVLSATVLRSPVVTNKGLVNGKMTWKMEFPITLTYESSERVVASQDLTCELMVQRCSVLKHPRGIRITQIILS